MLTDWQQTMDKCQYYKLTYKPIRLRWAKNNIDPDTPL